MYTLNNKHHTPNDPVIKYMPTTTSLVMNFSIVCIFFISSLYAVDTVPSIRSIKELDSLAVFSFAIMSDNKGEGPQTDNTMKRLVEWNRERNNACMIGLGDHVKKNWRNQFLPFINTDPWWHQWFLPNIADGENEYYGKNQGDWSSGTPILDEISPSPSIIIKYSANKSDYYAKIPVDKYTIHLIQLHYPDSPKNDTKAFRDESKLFLDTTLQKIVKDSLSIVIAAAHSRNGWWLEFLHDTLQEKVLTRCDLILSATTHFFKRKIYTAPNNKPSALVINTGSTSYPAKWCPPGYVQVHVLEKPLRLVLQYINLSNATFSLAPKDYSYVKVVNGAIFDAPFTKPDPHRDPSRTVVNLKDKISKEQLQKMADSLFAVKSKSDLGFAQVKAGLPGNTITVKDLFRVFPHNSELCKISISAPMVSELLALRLPGSDQTSVTLGLSLFNAKRFCEKLNRPYSDISLTGLYEVDLLEQWLIAMHAVTTK